MTQTGARTSIDLLDLIARQREALRKKHAKRAPRPKALKAQVKKDKIESDKLFGR